MSNTKKHALGLQGFTLIELMVAMLVFMIIMLGLVRGEIAAITANSGNALRDEALRLAEDELSRLGGLQFSLAGTAAALGAGGWTAPVNVIVRTRRGTTTFTLRNQITDIAAASVTALKRIDVAVGYTHGNGAVQAPTNMNRQVSLSTIIAQSN